ncbi:MAG: DUF1743 domain-containing protein [Thermoplasmata archaeon]|nr:MAG: DUF1743 domain-containing protein [Thermoplasmata archaeon]
MGIDDTDSVSGMCTTYLASELIQEFSECDVIGCPRLVRLNPNIPWKTRGNGAIAVQFGRGSGGRFPIGEIAGRTYHGFERGRDMDIRNAKKRVQTVVEEHARFEDANTNPAYIITRKKTPQSLYWMAVRQVVELKDVLEMLRDQQAVFKGYKNKRGLIGASAAVSWRPRDRTYEITTYREKKRWGTQRRVEKGSVIEMDRAFSSTFNNYDYINKNIVIAPNSPCPVLFGIRGDEPKDLPQAMERVKSEKKDRWLIFETNQGTDEHLQKRSIEAIDNYTSVITSGVVSSAPRTIEGGHVIFTIKNRKEIHCAAYEPTKEFRHLARRLICGDAVTVYGGIRKEPKTINIEKMKIEKLAEHRVKSENPRCPKCKRKMKSAGKHMGYRCKACKTAVREEAVPLSKIERDIATGFYEVPVCARRHLAKPLKRFGGQSGILRGEKR